MDEYELMLVVIPKSQFENIAAQVENWALIGPDGQSFDEASGRMSAIEERWAEITD